MRPECVIYAASHNDSTPDEPWNLDRIAGHHYAMQADFALEGLGNGPGRCLVVGSPLFEALELQKKGWSVWYVDVRRPPDCGLNYVMTADAATEGMGEEVFDAASSTCVLCHAGMGRYGDPIVEDADERIMKNLFRALKHGARAAVTFGPVTNTSMPLRLGNTHRIYNYETARSLASQFRILKESILDTEKMKWVGDCESAQVFGKDYLSMLLEKP